MELRWDTRCIHYYDSFSQAGDYARSVERRVRRLLQLREQVLSFDTQAAHWKWIGEQVCIIDLARAR